MNNFVQAKENQATVKKYRKHHFVLQGNYSAVSVVGTKSNEFVLRPIMNYFLTKKVALLASYYSSIKPDGSSNLSGFSFGSKLYIGNSGTEFGYNSEGINIIANPSFSYYLGAELQSRSLKADYLTISYTGYNVFLGSDWHFHDNQFINIEASYGSLKNAIGSPITKELKLISLGLGYGIMF